MRSAKIKEAIATASFITIIVIVYATIIVGIVFAFMAKTHSWTVFSALSMTSIVLVSEFIIIAITSKINAIIVDRMDKTE